MTYHKFGRDAEGTQGPMRFGGVRWIQVRCLSLANPLAVFLGICLACVLTSTLALGQDTSQDSQDRAGRPEALPEFVPPAFRLVYAQHFDTAQSLQGFVMSDPKAWQYSQAQASFSLEQARQSAYAPPHRSPVNIALIADQQFGDFVLEVDLMQTSREYGHRDMCLFFGFQDPANFYYAHLSTAADDHAHNIFRVHNAPRIKIASRTTSGVDWGQTVWQRIRLVRELESGRIAVYWNDEPEPIMEAVDKTFAKGLMGFGSFDDTGKVDNIQIWAPSAIPVEPPLETFPRSVPKED